MADVKRALTRDQWATAAKTVYFRKPRGFYDAGYGIEVHSDGTGAMHVFDDSWVVMVRPEDRHALAALALHGQPFGFTREDVERLRKKALYMEMDNRSGESDPDATAFENLADRIAALLPPEE